MNHPLSEWVIASLLLALGGAKMAGDLLDVPSLSGVAAATAASPSPKVFTTVEGLETFSTGFHVAWRDPGGAPHTLVIDRSVYSRLRGPYNRRNVWGAVLAYGPVLSTNPKTQEMFRSVVTFGLCGDAPLLAELGLDPSSMREVAIHYTPRAGSAPTLPMVLRADCEAQP